MKSITLFILLISFLSFGQRPKEVIDSIHSKRLCVDYPGITYFPEILNEYENSEYIFTGKVVEIICKETLEPSDYNEDGLLILVRFKNFGTF